MKQVKIAAFLGYGSKIQRYIDEPGLNDRTFNSIRELAKKYSLTNIKKTDKKEWAVSGRGNTIEWFVYTALMPDTNNNQPQPKDESKEVKEGLQIESNGNWIADGRVITLENDYSYEIARFERHGECMAAADAYNETYQKGYNPAAMEELYKALTALTNMCGIIPREVFTLSGQRDFQAILNASSTALTNAKTIKP